MFSWVTQAALKVGVVGPGSREAGGGEWLAQGHRELGSGRASLEPRQGIQTEELQGRLPSALGMPGME